MRETERKDETTDEVNLPDPAGLFGLDTASGAEKQDMERCTSTPPIGAGTCGHHAAAARGWVRSRVDLKLPVDTNSRDELRMPVGRARRTPPAELVAPTRVHTRGAALVPVAKLTTRRRRWVLSDADGRQLAELVEDQSAPTRWASSPGQFSGVRYRCSSPSTGRRAAGPHRTSPA